MNAIPVNVSQTNKNAFPVWVVNADEFGGGSGVTLVNTSADLSNIESPIMGQAVGVVETNSFWFYDGTTWTNTGSSIAKVESVNGLTGNIQLNAENLYLVNDDGETTNVSIEDGFRVIVQNAVTTDQLNLLSLTDNQVPSSNNGAYSPVWDAVSQRMLYNPLKKIGIGVYQEERIKGTNNQTNTYERGPFEISFGSETSESQGDWFAKDGNGIKITNSEALNTTFFINAIITLNLLSGKNVDFPVNATLRLLKNGVPTGLQITDSFTIGSHTIRMNFSSDQLAGLALNDIFTLDIDCVDSSGNYGDSTTKESYTIASARNFACFYRSIETGGFLYNIRDVAGDYLNIKKTDASTIPTTPTLISFTNATAKFNSTNLVYDDALKAFIMMPTSVATYDVVASVHVNKTGATGTVGELNLLAFVEKYNEDTILWEPHQTLNHNSDNYGRRFVLSSSGIGSNDYVGTIRIEEGGTYRMRLYWWDSGAGSLANVNENGFVSLSTGEVIPNSLVTSVTIKEGIIN